MELIVVTTLCLEKEFANIISIWKVIQISRHPFDKIPFQQWFTGVLVVDTEPNDSVAFFQIPSSLSKISKTRVALDFS